ncbi:alpha/beta hydrolase [Leptotrichia sp. OH3620_COT-345]|uniref:alpha/beta fold hydrolase n=1 Tax=Leptotrichia sp. OH3620_COT-345 TaxID=2491048 RepID=UPI000F64E28C|nr:alpha/beta hydrolase [Leptotrichia sp. OH3620_COT-345]
MKLSYEEKGNGETIILVHSYLWDRNMWNGQVDLLSKKYHCISIDLPSHGKETALLDENYSLKNLAEDIKVLIDEKGIKEYHYIGLSVGGMLIPYLYETDAEKIKSLIMMDSYSGAESPQKKALYFQMLDTIDQIKTIPPAMAEQIANMFFAKEKCNNENIHYANFIKRLENFEQEKIKDIVILGKAIFGREDKLETLSEIKCPLYFIVGNEDEPRPPKESIEMSKLVDGSTYIEVPEAGHISNIDSEIFVNGKFEEIFF